MKKIITYISLIIGSAVVLILVGSIVVAFMKVRLDGANERLEIREEKRAAVEDKWLDAHESGEDILLIIDDVTVEGNGGTLDWSDSNGTEGSVRFTIKSDESVAYLDSLSEYPENIPSYPGYFEQAITAELN